jgi:hypothetical protein
VRRCWGPPTLCVVLFAGLMIHALATIAGDKTGDDGVLAAASALAVWSSRVSCQGKACFAEFSRRAARPLAETVACGTPRLWNVAKTDKWFLNVLTLLDSPAAVRTAREAKAIAIDRHDDDERHLLAFLAAQGGGVTPAESQLTISNSLYKL